MAGSAPVFYQVNAPVQVDSGEVGFGARVRSMGRFGGPRLSSVIMEDR
ncbi:hypothetical protein YIM_13995 [Amycolatopsis sp. YIM 10]|nr:hypothetical protein YIM_13995 [Amycolatopsis sp. YIM 10]